MTQPSKINNNNQTSTTRKITMSKDDSPPKKSDPRQKWKSSSLTKSHVKRPKMLPKKNLNLLIHQSLTDESCRLYREESAKIIDLAVTSEDLDPSVFRE